jgi:hypothetical protein
MGNPKKFIRAESDKARIRTWHFPEFKPGSYLCTELFIPMKLLLLKKKNFAVINFVAQNCIVIQE